jgi:hypothetical protein
VVSQFETETLPALPVVLFEHLTPHCGYGDDGLEDVVKHTIDLNHDTVLRGNARRFIGHCRVKFHAPIKAPGIQVLMAFIWTFAQPISKVRLLPTSKVMCLDEFAT